jgi:FlaA1/EpsC-like NDP-sugar epimerase
MGKPVRLVDMARNLIRSSGLVPDKDIAIDYIGLRPGEKLHEELVGIDEIVETTNFSRIMKIRPSAHVNQAALAEQIQEMERLAIQGDTKALFHLLCALVPNFNPVGMNDQTNVNAESRGFDIGKS